MKSLVSLPAPVLCKIVTDTARIFSDACVLEAVRDAQKEMGDKPSMSAVLSAFSTNIAPMLLGEKYKADMLSILAALEGDTSEGSGTIRDLFSLVLLDKDYATLTAAIRKHGAESVLSALYEHGTPLVMEMLPALLSMQEEQRAWQTYMADMTAAIECALTGKTSTKVPFYSDLTKKKSPEHDSRNGKEIVADLAARLKKRKEKRKA